MLMESLTIQNYKGLRYVHVNGLKRCNLIFGMNNAGKSSLLEAVYLMVNAGGSFAIERILGLRGHEVANMSRMPANVYMHLLTSLYTERDIVDFYKNPITLTWNNTTTISLQLVNAKDSDSWSNADTSPKVQSYTMADLAVDVAKPALQVKLNDDVVRLFGMDENKTWGRENYAIFRNMYVRTSTLETGVNAQLYDKIAMTEYEGALVDALRIIEPRIESVNFLKNDIIENFVVGGEQRRPYVALKGTSKRYALSSMGDGINRILNIVLSLLNCKDGVLLIDEFENGLHYSVQTKLWQMIDQLAERLNVQVFATTHSEDCIRGFVESNAYRNGLAMRMELQGSKVVMVPFANIDRLAYAVNNNCEIR